jgi:osomolarity two-component system, sensor histidine kinase SLN1
VSHELKTPLNGILGMCATSIEENDVAQMRQALGIIFKSGDLLLRTLNDLLTFSANQAGNQELALEEREFRAKELEAQILAIFQQQAVEKEIFLQVAYDEAEPSAPLRDMTLYGDVHRILQIMINLCVQLYGLEFSCANQSTLCQQRPQIYTAKRHDTC